MFPHVTIAIPVRNGEDFIEEAISSILGQSFQNLEVVISDNASTDGTERICRRFARHDERVKYHRLDENIGAGPNFNRAFALGRGKYFKWHAHDDMLSPTFVERCVDMLDRDEELSLVFGPTKCIDSMGREIEWGAHLFMPPLTQEDPIERFRTVLRAAGSCFPIFGMFRTDILHRTCLHRPYYGSDRALIAEAALLGKIAEAPADAIYYNREHPNRSINIRSKTARATWINGKSAPRHSLEHIDLLRHLIEIARRHEEVASQSTMLATVARFALTRAQLGRYAIDIARYIAPGGSEAVRDVVLRSEKMKQVLFGSKRRES